jgi:hypothetical protein
MKMTLPPMHRRVLDAPRFRRERDDARPGGLLHASVSSEKNTKLAQRLGHLQPFIDVLTSECMAQLAFFWANLTPLSLQSCVEKGRVSGLMCSYNAINGVHSCGNSWLLQTVARESWGFDGYVTADCDADGDAYDSHTETPEQAVRQVLRAGTDNDCGTFVTDHAMSALNQSVITVADIDERLRKMLRVRMRLMHFDQPSALQTIPPSVICSPHAIELARVALDVEVIHAPPCIFH